MKIYTFYIEEKMLEELKKQTKAYNKKHGIILSVGAYMRKCIARGLNYDKEN